MALRKSPLRRSAKSGPSMFGKNRFLAVFDGGVNGAENGGAAGQGLEAAAIAAIAFGAADFDDHVADFPGRAAEAGI